MIYFMFSQLIGMDETLKRINDLLTAGKLAAGIDPNTPLHALVGIMGSIGLKLDP